MKLLKNIAKAILLWLTATAIFVLLAGGLESLMDNGYFFASFIWVAVCVGLVFLCKKCLSYRDMYKLSGALWFDRIMRK